MSKYTAMVAENPGKYPSRMGQPWSDAEDQELLDMLSHKCSIEEISESVQRTPGSIRSRTDLHIRNMAVKPTSIDIIAEELNVTEIYILKVLKKAGTELKKEPVKEVLTSPRIEKQDMLMYLLVDIKELLTEIRDNTRPVEYKPVKYEPPTDDSDIEVEEYEYEGDSIIGRYKDGKRLVLRLSGFKGEGDWNVAGTCPVRFEGDEGWVEAGDDKSIVTSSENLLEGQPTESLSGTDPIKHVREFLDCVKTRKQPAANADNTRFGHIACHVAAIGWQLGRKVRFDPKTETFIDDEEANRMCSRTRRDPWHA
mgnify:CR=1 FL=1